jgi:hypothetical protein
VLFRCAIQLSISSEHWAEITYEPADPVLSVMNNSRIAIRTGRITFCSIRGGILDNLANLCHFGTTKTGSRRVISISSTPRSLDSTPRGIIATSMSPLAARSQISFGVISTRSTLTFRCKILKFAMALRGTNENRLRSKRRGVHDTGLHQRQYVSSVMAGDGE